MTDVPTHLPGHELVSAGLADLAAGRETELALLLSMAAPRLRMLGFDVPAGGRPRPSHRASASSLAGSVPTSSCARSQR